jgi:hypothetical protein
MHTHKTSVEICKMLWKAEMSPKSSEETAYCGEHLDKGIAVRANEFCLFLIRLHAQGFPLDQVNGYHPV